MLGGAPGVGKSAVARHLLELAATGTDLVQWVDVDDLWHHQPWRINEQMTTMVTANLRAVADHAAVAGVDILVITWVFQTAEMHRLVTAVLPPASTTVSIQLRAERDTWRRRFEADPKRPSVDAFYLGRYTAAQTTPADHVVNTDGLSPIEVGRRVADIIVLRLA